MARRQKGAGVAAEKALGLVIRTVDFSETSKVCTLWTRELGKVRVLAKGARRLRGPFDSALDLLTVCSIVLLRKSSGGLDLLTEARVEEKFPRLRSAMTALYSGYYVAELLGDWTEDYDPHPDLFDEAVATLRVLGTGEVPDGLRLLRFELALLRELGYRPTLDRCAVCQRDLPANRGFIFSPGAGGLVCDTCRSPRRGQVVLTPAGLAALRRLNDDAAWTTIGPAERGELRRLFNEYVCYLLGRRPRTMPYLGS